MPSRLLGTESREAEVSGKQGRETSAVGSRSRDVSGTWIPDWLLLQLSSPASPKAGPCVQGEAGAPSPTSREAPPMGHGPRRQHQVRTEQGVRAEGLLPGASGGAGASSWAVEVGRGTPGSRVPCPQSTEVEGAFPEPRCRAAPAGGPERAGSPALPLWWRPPLALWAALTGRFLHRDGGPEEGQKDR